ncbi:MAG: hypothetical protein K2X03_00790 [Bryobacteraceae bacterium]|nr:hypothetical protein [Bryobacteraceae bacterium]
MNFRLTDEEFAYLREACGAQGARSISDFARSAVLRQADRSGSSEPSTQALAELHSMLSQLEARVGQLGQKIDAAAETSPA